MLFEAVDEGLATKTAREVRDTLPPSPERQVLGPAPAVLARIKERWRVHLLLKCFTRESFDAAMKVVRTVEDRTTHTLRVTLDVDPMAML